MGTISQYHTQFLEFGSEILTRDFKQTKQHIQSRMRKKNKKKCPSTVGPNFLLKLEAGKSASFSFFFASHFHLFSCSFNSNHVSKFQVLTSKIERCVAKFPPKCLCIQIYIHFRDSSITFEREWPMKGNAYVPTPRPKIDVHAQKNWANSIHVVFRTILEKATQTNHEKKMLKLGDVSGKHFFRHQLGRFSSWRA